MKGARGQESRQIWGGTVAKLHKSPLMTGQGVTVILDSVGNYGIFSEVKSSHSSRFRIHPLDLKTASVSYHPNPQQITGITNFRVTVSLENTYMRSPLKILKRLRISHLPNSLYIPFDTLSPGAPGWFGW